MKAVVGREPADGGLHARRSRRAMRFQGVLLRFTRILSAPKNRSDRDCVCRLGRQGPDGAS
jgi:hypothetical protein